MTHVLQWIIFPKHRTINIRPLTLFHVLDSDETLSSKVIVNICAIERKNTYIQLMKKKPKLVNTTTDEG